MMPIYIQLICKGSLCCGVFWFVVAISMETKSKTNLRYKIRRWHHVSIRITDKLCHKRYLPIIIIIIFNIIIIIITNVIIACLFVCVVTDFCCCCCNYYAYFIKFTVCLFSEVMISRSHKTYNARVDKQNGYVETVPEWGITNFHTEFSVGIPLVWTKQ
jgi:hypothetical protein